MLIPYCSAVESAAARLEPVIRKKTDGRVPDRWTALQLLDPDEDLLKSLRDYLGFSLPDDEEAAWVTKRAREALFTGGFYS